MGYDVKRMEDYPAVLIHYTEPYDPPTDAGGSAREIGPTLGSILVEGAPKAYLVFDLSDIKISFAGMVQALAELFSPENAMPGEGDLPIDVEAILVGNDRLVAFSAEAVTQEQYGANDLPHVFGSMAEAQAYIEEDLNAITA